MQMITLTRYNCNVLNHVLSQLNQNSLVIDSYTELRDESEVAEDIINSAHETHYIGLDNSYVLLPMGKPVYHPDRLPKQFYFVAHRSSLAPVITFTVGFEETNNILMLVKQHNGFIIESTTTTITVSKVVLQ